MALGTKIFFDNGANDVGQDVTPRSKIAVWQTVIDAGGMIVQDAASITNPDTQITASTRHIFHCQGATTCEFQMRYDNGVTPSTDPVIKCFGRTILSDGTSPSHWTLLKTKSGSNTATITTSHSSADTTDGTHEYTVPDPSTTAWDIRGFAEIIFGVETAFAGSGGDTGANALGFVRPINIDICPVKFRGA